MLPGSRFYDQKFTFGMVSGTVATKSPKSCVFTNLRATQQRYSL